MAARVCGNVGHQLLDSEVEQQPPRSRASDRNPQVVGDQSYQFELVVSETVQLECGRGNAAQAARRLARLAECRMVMVSANADALAGAIAARIGLPESARIDALHIAVAAEESCDFLVTWNCAHIANAAYRLRIESECEKAGFRPPMICTPLTLA